jgi:hypothetical protein
MALDFQEVLLLAMLFKNFKPNYGINNFSYDFIYK